MNENVFIVSEVLPHPHIIYVATSQEQAVQRIIEYSQELVGWLKKNKQSTQEIKDYQTNCMYSIVEMAVGDKKGYRNSKLYLGDGTPAIEVK